MGIQGVARNRPAPKATCARCRRPIAVLKSGRCAYCGAVLDGARPPEDLPVHPEALIALDPQSAPRPSPRVIWLRRVIALGTASALIGLFARACMRT